MAYLIPVILTLNAGSSSLKFARYRGPGPAMLRGLVEFLGDAATISVHGTETPELGLPDLSGKSYDAVLSVLLEGLIPGL